MRNSLALPLPALYGFLLALARMAGVIVFVPLPGLRHTPEPVRAVLALALTVAMFPVWPRVESQPGVMPMAGWILAEAALGLLVGLAVAVAAEAFTLAAQIMGLQAGYAYASTIDPTTQADSSVLLVFSQLAAGMLFFAVGLDREVLRILARTFETHPPGALALPPGSATAVLRMCGAMFAAGLRLALPVAGLLILADLALALLGRLNAQLQLLSLAMPVKMLAALALLTALAPLLPRLYRAFAGEALAAAGALLGL